MPSNKHIPAQLNSHSAASGWRERLGILLSPVLVASTTLVLRSLQRVMLGAERDHYLRPYGIAFIIPLVICTLLAGWRAGTLTLLLSLIAAYTVLMGHVLHNGITASEITELSFITLVGGAVIVAVEMQQRNVRLLRELASISEQRQAFFRDVLVNVTDGKLHLVDAAAELPPNFNDHVGRIDLQQGNLGAFRRMVADASRKAGLPQERLDDLVTAASECAMNAVVHAGGGAGTVSWDGADRVRVHVADTGRGISIENLPSAALEKGFTTAGSMGFGMKMMLSSTDHVWLLTGPAGTVVLMEQHAAPLPPAWLAKNHGELLQAAPEVKAAELPRHPAEQRRRRG